MGIKRILLPPVVAAGMILLASCGGGGGTTDPGIPVSEQIADFGNRPRWSPDGQRLAFAGTGADLGLWVWNRGTLALTRVTDEDHPHLYDYRWSPDGQKLAFGGAGAPIENTSGIFTVNADGSGLVRWHATGQDPDWDPDGSGLVFAENDAAAGLAGVFRLTFADTSVTRLTFTGLAPRYSPDGSRVAFRELAVSDTLAYRLKVMDPAGAAASTVADTCVTFDWTQDSDALIFSYGSYNPYTYVLDTRVSRVSAVGGPVIKLLSSAMDPSVSADRVLYVALYGDLIDGIYSAGLFGGDIAIISDTGYQPAVTPDGSAVAYTRNNGIWMANL
ncbi:MAG: hypothetical protein C4524_01765 [Candidatus Zixiibacteriota bacterium]|nr:MAG: hypothetical protein C4524_01765 [candidate division Zixibacteria bacterium]